MTSFSLFSCGSCEFASVPLEVHAPQHIPDETCWESLPLLDEFEGSKVDPLLVLVDQETLPPLYEDDWFVQAFPGDNFSSAMSDTTSISASPAESLSPALEEETSACSEPAHPAQKESSCKTVLINARKGGENNNGQLVRITINDLQEHFHESMETAASHLVKLTLLAIATLADMLCSGYRKINHEACVQKARCSKVAVHKQGEEEEEQQSILCGPELSQQLPGEHVLQGRLSAQPPREV